MSIEVFEITNPSLINDLKLAQQIEHGVNDWCARDHQGREFIREGREAALAAARIYNQQGD